MHYIENEVTLGHNKTCTSTKQKWDVCVYRKSEKIHPPTKIGNVSFAKPHHEYEYDKILRCFSRKRPPFDPRSPHDFDVSFCQKDWEELAKETNGTASVLQFIPTTFSSTTVTTSMTPWPATVWDIVSNLNLHVKESFYEQLSKHRDNEIIKDIYLFTSKQSTSTTWFSFRQGVITASIAHETLPKLNRKTPLHKNKASTIYVQRYVITKRSQKRVNL